MTSIISQIQARNLLLDDFDFTSSTQARERITEFKEDPLVLACTLKKYVESGQGYLSLDNPDLIELITDEDRNTSEIIRKYYSKKFFWNALSGNKPLSGYRQRLINLLENRISKCKDQDCGVYYKLPYFYEEDVVYEDFKKIYNTSALSPLGNKRSNVFAKRLTFIKTTLGTQQKRKIKFFWFHDDNNDLYSVQINSDNELITLFESIILSSTDHVFETRLAESRIDNMHFYKLYSFKLLRV